MQIRRELIIGTCVLILVLVIFLTSVSVLFVVQIVCICKIYVEMLFRQSKNFLEKRCV